MSMLRSDLLDFSDAYIVLKGDITLSKGNARGFENRFLAFQNYAPFTKKKKKINNLLINNAIRPRYCNASVQFA